jgi:hypothetical protein
MELQERLKMAQEAGPRYTEIASMFEAAITDDEAKLQHYRNHESGSVRFAAFVNPLTVPSHSDIDSDSLIKYAAIHNPSTSTEILDYIGLNKSSVNPIIPEAIHTHKNASKEFQVFRAITDFGMMEDEYNEEEEKYFFEAIYGENGFEVESLEALFYLNALNLIPAPDATREIWTAAYDLDQKNETLFEMFGRLPAIPESLVYELGGVQEMRCLAAELSLTQATLTSLSWDSVTLNSGSAGAYWQESRSPRSSLAQNENADTALLRRLFEEESSDQDGLTNFPHGVLWRLSYNPSSPSVVLEGIVKLLEDGLITDSDTQAELLVGEPYDAEAGLATNPSVKGDLRKRVEILMKNRNINPEDHPINED